MSMNPNENLYAPRLSSWDWITLVILIIGGLAWGVVGLVGVNVIADLFNSLPVVGAIPILLRIFYIIVGLSAIWVAIFAYMRFVASRTMMQAPAGQRPIMNP